MIDAEFCNDCDPIMPRVNAVTAYRCTRCLRFACVHLLVFDGYMTCSPRTRDCYSGEERKVYYAWQDQLRMDGYCVTYSGKLDGHFSYVRRRDDGKWTCEFCGRDEADEPPKNSCTGCGGHSIDPDCPMHGRE